MQQRGAQRSRVEVVRKRTRKPPAPKCLAAHPAGSERAVCQRPKGHEGKHQCPGMHIWSDDKTVTYVQQLSIGRIVRYLTYNPQTDGIREQPAMILEVFPDQCVALGVYGRDYRYLERVPYTQDVDTVGAWKWPARSV